ADIEVNREVAADAAVYHTVSDPAPLASQLNRLLTDSALRTRLATVGRERSRRFTWERAAQQTLAVLQATVQERSAVD
ncbi:MAG TPA: glycosyl transferase family 1, partial [Chloroflexota bacterium]|nr:glycosyl transferase family 1 [Chloroflexota bacterium]